jgi:mono/diheme cytochrome c family protein
MRVALVSGIALVLAAFAVAAEPVKNAPAAPADPDAVDRGSRLYEIYCTSCHGERGRGDGPAAATMDAPLPDLTLLAGKNDDVFPTARVMLAIDGRRPLPGHTRGNMPIWGLSFQEPDSDYYQEDTVRKKIQDLVAYLKTLQAPTGRK